MKKRNLPLALLVIATLLPWACKAVEDTVLLMSKNGKTEYLIALARDASSQEKNAASELASYLKKITGAEFQTLAPEDIPKDKETIIAVGAGAAKVFFPSVNLNIKELTHDGVVIRTEKKKLLLSGAKGASRGCLYAVFAFLEEGAGVRWWTDKCTHIPSDPNFSVKVPVQRYVPTFEYREVFIFDAFDWKWQLHNKCNGGNVKAAGHASKGFKTIPLEWGGSISFRGGFAHTLLGYVVPADKTFKTHPEWFPEINGKRKYSGPRSQLCLTNKELLEHVKKKAREILRNSPKDCILSISQGDSPASWRCQCKNCKKVEKEEGSMSGPLIRFVNAVAADMGKEFPEAKIETLAYSFTRKPSQTKPLSNILIRLCDIESSFAVPLTAKVNSDFARDLKVWASVSKKIYIWDYVTNFSNYLYPFPNLFVMGPNLKFMSKNNVKGVFEQGSFQSFGGEFSELRAWVLAKLLWNPNLNSIELIDEFLNGYYGEGAPFIKQYINLIHNSVEKDNYYLDINNLYTPTLEALLDSDRLFRQAERVVSGNPKILKRVHTAHLPILMAILINYPKFQAITEITGRKFKLDLPLNDLFNEFVKYGTEAKISRLSEADSFPIPSEWPNKYPVIRKTALPPLEFRELHREDWYDLQDNAVQMYFFGKLISMEKDKDASDGYALRMPANHKEWAIQAVLPEAMYGNNDDEWTVYVAVKVISKKKNKKKLAFTAGIYNKKNSNTNAKISIIQNEIPNSNYNLYKIGNSKLNSKEIPETIKVWVAPGGEDKYFDSIWVDRIFLVRNRKH